MLISRAPQRHFGVMPTSGCVCECECGLVSLSTPGPYLPGCGAPARAHPLHPPPLGERASPQPPRRGRGAATHWLRRLPRAPVPCAGATSRSPAGHASVRRHPSASPLAFASPQSSDVSRWAQPKPGSGTSTASSSPTGGAGSAASTPPRAPSAGTASCRHHGELRRRPEGPRRGPVSPGGGDAAFVARRRGRGLKVGPPRFPVPGCTADEA